MAVCSIGETSYDTLSAAITAANALDEGATITLNEDIEFNAALTVSKNIIIEGSYTIMRATGYAKTFITVSSGVTLTLRNVTIDGNHNWTIDMDSYNNYADNGLQASSSSLFVTAETDAPVCTAYTFVVKGNLIIEDNVTMQNNYGTGLISVASGATLTTKNCVFTHLYGTSNNVVASIASGAVWTINEGTLINGNHANGNGGVSRSDGHIIMNGGIIENNTGVNSNGTVFMFYGAKSYFELNDGIIRNNKGVWGVSNGRCAAVYMHNKSVMVMNGGLIEINTGNGSGGVDAPYAAEGNGSTVTINGGSIINNVSAIGNAAADIRGGDMIQIYGGTFTQDISQWCADDFAAVQLADGTWGVKTVLYQVYVCIDGTIFEADMYACINGVIDKVYGIQSRWN